MTRTPRILFIADAGPQVGGGHVMRSLTLARALRAKGAECRFVETSETAKVLDVFGRDMPRAAAPEAADILVVDHYRLGAEDEQALRRFGRLAVLEDMGRPHGAADLILDPSYGRSPRDYEAPVVLAGAQYALVSEGFVGRRGETPSRRRAPETVLVSLGLTDVGGVTRRVIETLGELTDGMRVVAVTGSGAPSLAWLKTQAADGLIDLHVDARHMDELTASADLAVGAGGSSVWERACLGLPSITLILADNQRPTTQALNRAGALIALELEALETDLPAAWASLREADARMALSQASMSLCDGLGAQRAADAILRLI